MATKRIHARTPTRIDLAGGTLDLWPLYLLLKDPLTINLAIDLHAETSLEEGPAEAGKPGEIWLRSEDQKFEWRLSWDALESASSVPPALDLHFKLLRFFARRRAAKGWGARGVNLTLETVAHSPAGAGIGGSSALNISLVGALAEWAGENPRENPERWIEVAKDIETTVINVPAGLQDYYSAMFGGLQGLHWGPGSHARETFQKEIVAHLEDHTLLFYSGRSRNSGINNWSMYKRMIDQQEGIQAAFQSISNATQKLGAALKRHDWETAGAAIDEEWSLRKRLAPGITTPEIDRAYETARAIAPAVGKVCGAGGGGCFFIFLPATDAAALGDAKGRITQALSQQGMRPIPFKAAAEGLRIG